MKMLGLPLLTLFCGGLLLTACGQPSEAESIQSAKKAFANGDRKGAVVQVKALLQVAPESGAARLLLGRLLLESGDPAASELELRKAQTLKYPDVDVAPLLARALLGRLQYKKVLEEFSNLDLHDARAQADLNVTLAAAMALNGEQAKGMALLESTLKATPDFVPALLLKARLIAKPETLNEALALIAKAIEQEPGNYEAWQMQGDLYLLGKRDLSKAAESFTKALALAAVTVQPHASLILVHMANKDLAAARRQLGLMAKDYPNHTQTRFAEARIAFLAGDARRARESLQPLLQAAPDSVPVLILAGVVELQLRSLDQAEKHLIKALALQPDLPIARQILADVELRRDQPTKALEILRPNLMLKPPDAMSLALAAQAHLFSGNLLAAEKLYAEAAQLYPNNARARTSMALTLLGKGQADTAFAELEAIAASSKETLADLSLISALMRVNQFDRAMKAIDRLEAKEPDRPVPPNLRGRVQLRQGETAAARKSFEMALRKDASFLPAVASLAAIDLAEKKPEQAEARYRTLLKTDPKNSRALTVLATLRARNGGSKEEIGQLLEQAVQANPTDPEPRILLVHSWIDRHNPKAALDAAQSGVVAIPGHPELLDALGSMQLVTGEVRQAINTFGQLVALQPTSTKALLRLADGQLNANDDASAERSFVRALQIDPALPSAQRGLIALAIRSKNADSAIKFARTVQRQQPKEGVGHLLEGDIHAEFKNFDSAITAYRAGLDKAHAGPLALRLFAILELAKRPTEAASFANEWLKKYPSDLPFRFFLGVVATNKQDFDTAIRRYREVIAIDPKHVMAINNQAWVLAKMKRPGAVALAEQAQSLAPRDAAVKDTLAFAFAQDGQIDRAVGAARAALALAHDEPVYRFNLAKLLLQSGDKPGAKGELDELTKLGAKFYLHKEVAELVSKL